MILPGSATVKVLSLPARFAHNASVASPSVALLCKTADLQLPLEDRSRFLLPILSFDSRFRFLLIIYFNLPSEYDPVPEIDDLPFEIVPHEGDRDGRCWL